MALQPRGIRNNNPGNIVWSARNNWQGQLPHDPQIEPRFCRFDTAHNGTRALAKL
ncbi:TPA: structural protein, partial [Pseudomonas aeruginosa]